jgi:hypothetical protein
MTQTLTLFIPPQQLINANDRLHWRVKARKTAALRALTHMNARAQLEPVKERQHVTVTFGFLTHTRRDAGNWYPTVKACLDGITDAQIWPDDNDSWIVGPDLRTGALSPDVHDRPRPLRRVSVHITLEEAA